jgi:hypothetical protein
MGKLYSFSHSPLAMPWLSKFLAPNEIYHSNPSATSAIAHPSKNKRGITSAVPPREER